MRSSLIGYLVCINKKHRLDIEILEIRSSQPPVLSIRERGSTLHGVISMIKWDWWCFLGRISKRGNLLFCIFN